MCGICGFVHHNFFDEAVIKQMNETIKYRGPDDEGYWQEIISPINFDSNEGNVQIGMGHNRLSILDLSVLGHQPMTSVDNRVTICYNGEIYNYREIRGELARLGYSFCSNCDTEVIIYAYEAWGIECVKKFNGMFAIALYDSTQREFYLMRDRMGVKPLYYFYDGNKLIFASELKPIMSYPNFPRKLDFQALANYLPRLYIAAPRTIFEDTYKLAPGHILRLSIDRENHFSVSDAEYWSVSEIYANRVMWEESYEETKRRLHDLLLDAVRLRLISDVPVGAFLSGGYDSTLVVALMQKLAQESGSKVKTFTIGFDESAYDESPFANAVAGHLRTDHTCRILKLSDAQRYIEELPYFYDEPMADSSAIATMLLSKITRERVTVSLSGDAGDELFCGYDRYHRYCRLKRYFRKVSKLLNVMQMVLPIKEKISSMDLRRLSAMFYLDSRGHAINYMAYVYWDRYDGLLSNPYISAPVYQEMPCKADDGLMGFMLTDMVTYLPDDIMVKVDRATMACSLESRSPLLDYRVVEAALALPIECKYYQGVKKRILKDIAYEHVPRDLLDRPKQGFAIPLAEWMREDFHRSTRGLLGESYVRRQGIFSTRVVSRMIKGLENSRDYKNYATQLWTLFVFQLWWEKYMT